MPEYKKIKGVHRKEAVGMDSLMKLFIRQNGLSASLNTRRVFDAWDAVSGASQYTLNRFFRDGRLFITVSSSMVRTHLEMQKAALLEALNGRLREDSLFDADCKLANYVKELIIK
ncbi:MAG: DUF721 domain-containing protein [Candidatus Cryptobacteroides sp.]